MNYSVQDVVYVGVIDKDIDFFEGIYKVPEGVTYNSYVIIDDKIAVMDAVDQNFGDEWLANINKATGGKAPDYLIVQHMEPDHSANVKKFADEYPDALIVGNNKTFVMLSEYFGTDFAERRVVVADGDKLSLGKHELTFIFAPMVHWPEVTFTYDSYNKTLFSADAFGKFGTYDGIENWDDEARRYYIGIVGKYGKQVSAALRKVLAYNIGNICPLHGPVLGGDLSHYLGLYTKWSGYEAEEEGVLIAYSSVYGHTKEAVNLLKEELINRGYTNVKTCDLVRCDRSECVAQAFRYSKLVLATTTYNADIFPAMREFLDCLSERNYQNRVVGLIENGTWAPVVAKLMKAKLEKCANLNFLDAQVKIRSNLDAESKAQIVALADALINI
ncbi:MAG: FprA family A-type flavoprotein [Candidatus Coproplasma sp.]